ncbi:alpha/beta hydrolase [Novosphingobium sp. PC22D]|uniref:alpha/beta fold hydrolase n=1 Tax=Novosphingobium sp. PC22D TaxID=1962403 RepID=UPI000BF1EC51|nr:alpha/beta hydrolase [Novosphingobium sp. PC22D]
MTKRIVRVVGIVLLICGLIFLGWFIPAKAGWFASDREAMVERYAQPPSRLVTVDGVPIHVRVEGKGFPVVMFHGTGVNLHEWDPLAERLKDDFTVVRLDWPPYGLSGPNPRGYTTPEAARLAGRLLDELGYKRFATVATSNGSNVALTLNAMEPGRVAAMAFSIIPLERPSQTRKVDWKIRAAASFHEAVMPEYHPRIFYRWVFEDTGHKGWTPPDYLVRMMYDMSNLPKAIENQKSYIADNARLFKTTDVGAVAGKVTAPVLLQWCWEDTIISQGPEASVRRFTNTDVKVIEYPHVGHWPMWEIPDRFADDIRGFLKSVDLEGTSAAQADSAAQPDPADGAA